MAVTATATAVASASATTSSSSIILPRRHFLPPASASARCRIHPPLRRRARLRVLRQVSVGGSDVSSSSDAPPEQDAAERKVGERVRVTAPVRVHHVAKAPGLELRGMEGVVRHHVAVWKGKRVTANLSFKVEFELKLDGQDKPIRFLAHLREEEFEIVGDE